MKLNLKSTIAAPADHKGGQRALNGIIGNTKRGIVVDQTLDPNSNNPVSNKPISTALAALAGQLAKGQVVFLDQLPESGEPHKVYVLTATNQRYWWDGSAFVKIVPTDIKDSATIKHTLAENKISLDLDEAIKEKINAALQKPAGLTKTELVGVGANGQENIEIGDNLTLVNGKLSATGGGSGGNVPPRLNLMNDDLTVRTSLTKEELENIEKGLYNSVEYIDDSLGDYAEASLYFPENAILAFDKFIFSIYKVAIKKTGSTISASIVGVYVYELLPDEKAASDGTYPITINRVIEASSGGVNFLQATLDEPDVWGDFEGTYTGTIDPHKVNVAILPDPKNKYTLLTKITDEGIGSATIITDRQPVTLSFANNEIHSNPAGTYFHAIHVQNSTVNIDFNYYSTYGFRYRTFKKLKNKLQDKIICCSGFIRINNKAKNVRVINLINNTIEYFDNDTGENASIDLTDDIYVGDKV